MDCPYVILVRGYNDDYVGRLDFEFDNDREAVCFAFSLESPFGHELKRNGRLVGSFAGSRSWAAEFEDAAR